MGWMQFTLAIVGAAAWPTTLVTVALVCRPRRPGGS